MSMPVTGLSRTFGVNTMKNLNYLILPDDTTAALTPKTKIIATLSGKYMRSQIGLWSTPSCSPWYFLPIGCVTFPTIEEWLEMCQNADDVRNHEFIVDAVLCSLNCIQVLVKEI